MGEGMRGAGNGWSRRSVVGAGAVAVAALIGGGAAYNAAVARRGVLHDGEHQWLRVASFNIHHGASPDDELDLGRIAERIEAMDADLVGLQEVDRFWDRSDHVDQPRWLADRLGMKSAYGANETRPGEGGRPQREYGTAVLSRWPIVEHANTPLPHQGDKEQRGLLRTVVAAPGGELTFATTHLVHDEFAAQRLEQSRAVAAEFGDDPRRTIVVGDFNARPGTPPIETMTKRFTDAWETAGSGAGHSFPATGPDRRIDYIFASADIDARRLRVADRDAGASDHLPVVGEFAMRRS